MRALMHLPAALIFTFVPILLLAASAQADVPRHDESAGYVGLPPSRRGPGCYSTGNLRRITFAIDVVRVPGQAGGHHALADARQAVAGLRFGIQPFVIVASAPNGPKVFGGSCTLAADRFTKRVADLFLKNLDLPAAPADPLPVIREAFGRPADLVYLLVDHDWPDHKAVTRDVIDRATQPWRRCRVNVIVYRGPGGAGVSDAMLASARSIAEATGGRVRVVEPE